MSVFNLSGNKILSVFRESGQVLSHAYDANGIEVFPDFPTGNLNASSVVPLPDIYNNGHGFTCTGLAFDTATNSFLIGDIGKITPEIPGFASKLIRVTADFLTVIEQINLYQEFPSMSDVQGVTIDTSDGSIWFCSTSENKIRHIDTSGNSIGSITLSDKPTGVSFSATDNCLWVLTYASTNNILKVSKVGIVLEHYTFGYQEQLDQCYFDVNSGLLYITAGDNYISRNNVYTFDTNTHIQAVACTVDSYAVEGIWVSDDKMIILNDGYYHSAITSVNQANIYIK